MTTLRSSLQVLATEFASSVLHAIRGASLEEILSETGNRKAAGRGARAVGEAPVGRPGKSRRLGRRSPADIAAVVDHIVGLLGKHPKGLRAEEIRQKLSLQAKELPRPIADALSAKRISKQGQKRATTYFAGGSAKAAPKASKKRGKKG